MTTFADIVSALTNQSFSFEELKTINMLANQAHRKNQTTAAVVVRTCMKPGDKVTFDSRKLGQNVSGVILKIKPKNVLIDCGTLGNWNVPASMLSPV